MEQQTLTQPGNGYSATLEGRREVMYIYSDAFTNCDCGKGIMLSRRAFADPRYTGSCKSCGKSYTLLNNKLQEL